MARLSQQTRQSFRDAARKIERFAREAEQETPQATREIGEEIMTDVKASSSSKGVPVDTGTLRASGTVEGPDNLNFVVLGFGGPAAPYALVQHERTDYSHTVGEARYLVRGLERWEPGGSAAMAALKRNMEEGIRIARAS